ncbi:CotH kinase family protein [Evansella tamaricis]|uniref:CotH kinase family protein n=1 Tax=Evansella tamaricis TaxID=2069301 RepID=A0ABS6JJY4_9BACI|nr:CotH kinase family protein [Evansella tamaricis]MBU9713514.1 CotH kinase family protein [Evansella tamaricis]
MQHKKTKISLFLLIPVLFLGWILAFSVASGPIISDENLEAAIRVELNYERGEIRADQLIDIQELRIRGMGIESLEGIQHMTGLISLDLRDNNIEDISYLSELTKLKNLNLRGNRLKDIESLANLESLIELNLRDNSIQDISPLSDLIVLRDLNLRYNQITNIEALRNLESLRDRLYLEGNSITDYSPISNYLKEINDTDVEFDEEFLSNTPSFSHPGGFYDSEFELEITSPIQEGVIYYTLDGSEPDPMNNSQRTLKYTGPITIKNRTEEPNTISNIPTNFLSGGREWREPESNVTKATVVRSKIVNEDSFFSSYTTTQTYFVDAEYTLPVISISTDSKNLFDDEIGIYVPGVNYNPELEELGEAKIGETGNYEQRGREWERPVHLEFFETNRELAFSQNLGVRIHGGYTRSFPQKSLRLYARNDYGSNVINYSIFGDDSNDSFSSLLLRQSGNDWGRTMFADALMQEIVNHTSVETQAYRPSIVFINGEYWGIHNIRERYDHRYFRHNYGIERDDLVVLESNAEVDTGEQGDNGHYLEMMEYVENNDLSSPEEYAYVTNLMDTDNYITYMLSQIYFRNTDWPQSNIRYWRTKRNYEDGQPFPYDGRWRWLLYDTDHGFAFHGNEAYKHDTLEYLFETRGDHWSTSLFRNLLENYEFRNKFINEFADHLNTTFSPDKVNSLINKFESLYEPEIIEHRERWGLNASLNSWHSRINNMRDFASNRPLYVREHIASHFDLSGTVNITVKADESVGTIKINSLNISTETPGIQDPSNWSGVYFKDVPISITAEPKEGYKFEGWGNDISDTSQILSINLYGDIVLEPIFTKVN